MDSQFEKKYHEIEKKHWWFVSRREYVKSLIRGFRKNASVLDIGCSSGILIEELEELGFKRENISGIDISEVAIRNCHEKGFINTSIQDATKPTFDKKFDIIIASDCLEHIENHEEAAKNWRNLLNEGGLLIVFVPAFEFLWSDHDVANHHYRRYTYPQLKNVLFAEDFEIKEHGYWNIFLFFPVVVVRFLKNMFSTKDSPNTEHSGDLSLLNPIVNKAIYGLLRIEQAMLKFIRMPFGVSTYIVLTKK